MRTITTTLLLAALAAQPIFACCGFSPAGQPVQFGQQENIVIYNSKTKTEYFIRNARFVSEAKEFGFIAPTPTQPEITKVNPEIFNYLNSKQPVSRNTEGVAASVDSKAAGGVEVVDIVEVAGYKATILKASDSKALTDYLEEHNYATSPSLTEWTEHYIEKGWYLTAFQVINKEEALQTGVLCMKFTAETPFNPYYVPKDNIKGSASLDISFVSDQIFTPTIGKTEPYNRRSWNTKLNAKEMATVSKFLSISASELPSSAFLAHYSDYHFPTHQSDDIFFQPRPVVQNAIGLLGPEEFGGSFPIKITVIAGVVILVSALYGASKRRKAGTS